MKKSIEQKTGEEPGGRLGGTDSKHQTVDP